MANEFGGQPVYNPSAPSGMATNTMNGAAAAYGPPPSAAQQGVFVGWSGSDRKAKPPTDPKQRKLFGDSYPHGKAPITMSPAQLLSAFDSFGRKDYLKFRNLFIAAGLVSAEADAVQVRDAYRGLISDAMDMQSQGVMLSPMAMVKNLIRQNGLNPNKIGANEDFMQAATDAAKHTKETSLTVYDLKPEDARMTLEQAIQQKLGRAPTHAEVEDFIAAAQTRAENNPTETTTEFTPGKVVEGGDPGSQTTVQRADGKVVGTTVTSVDQGFDANSLANMANNRAKNAPDYASYQAISQYFPALLQALGSTV